MVVPVALATLLTSIVVQGTAHGIAAAAAGSTYNYPPPSGPAAHVVTHAPGAAASAPTQQPTPTYITSPLGSASSLATPNFSVPSSSCTPELLSNASFESSSSWAAHDDASSVTLAWVSNSTAGREGSGFLQSSTSVSGGSVWQNTSTVPAQGDAYEGSIWVKADAVLSNPVTGTLTLSATGGTVDTGSSSFSVGNSWSLVTAPLYVAHGSHTGLAMTLTMSTTGVTYDWDAAQMENAGLANASFEQGSLSGWSLASGAQAAVYRSNKSIDGAYFAQMNSPQQGGIYQNLSMSLGAGQSYELAAWVRADTSTNVNGDIALLASGGPTGATYFTAGPTWQLVEAPLDIQSGSYSSLQAQLLVSTTNTNIDIDGMSLINTCLKDASMEYTDKTDWQVLYQPSGTTASYGFKTGVGGWADGGGWMQMSTTGGVTGIGQLTSASFTAGEHKQGGVWVKSDDGTAYSGDLAACADGSGASACGTTAFTVQNAWTWVSAPLDIPSTGSFTRLRLQIYMDTAGHTLDVDAASWAPTTVGTPLPGAPTNVGANSPGNNGQATVSWSAPTAYQGNTVNSYTVTPFLNGVAQTSQAVTVSASTLSTTLTGLTAEGPYIFAVTATNSAYGTGAPAASAPVTTITMPGAVTGLSATGANAQATVSWTAPASNGGSPITSYTVTPYVGSNAQTSTNVNGSTTSATITGLSNGTSYTFQVLATNAAGSGPTATSNAVTPAAVPGAPTAVSGTAGDTRAVVTWTAPANGGSPITSYTVTPYVGNAPQTSLAVSVSGSYGNGVTTTAAINGLTDGSRYTFSVTATNSVGTGPAGTSAAAVPAPPAPLTYTPPSGYDAGAAPNAVAVGDLNSDHWNDIVSANGNAGSVSVLLNQVRGGGHAGGTFAQPGQHSSAGSMPIAVALGSFRNNGIDDAAVVNASGTVGVMLGNGDGTLQAESAVQSLPNGDTAESIAVADLNGDGNLDIVVGLNVAAYPNPTGVAVFLGNGQGGFSAPTEYQLPDGNCGFCGATFHDTGLLVADLNGDGHPDVVETVDTTDGSDRGKLFVLLNQGSGTLAVPSTSVNGSTDLHGVQGGSPGSAVAITDLNGDGYPDIVTIDSPVGSAERGVDIFFGKGDGTFQPFVTVADPALNGTNGSGNVTAVSIADMNGDGFPDIVTADTLNSGGGGISVYLNPWKGGIDVPVFVATPSFAPRGMALGDVNGDSETDVVLESGQSQAPNVLVLRNGTDFPPLGGPLGPNEMHGCAMCQALRGGGAVRVSGQYPVNVNSGEMSHTFTDISIPARGYPLAITQTYNSLNAGTDAGLGYGWWSPLFMSLTQDASSGVTTVTQEDGAQAQFWSSTLQPLAPRTQATLTHNGDGTWTFVRNGMDTFTFNSSGQITSLSDRSGDSLSFGYSGGHVTSLTHSDGRSLQIAWSNGHISSITDSNVSGMTRLVSFSYDGSNQLTDIDWTVNGAGDRNEHFEYASSSWTHGLTGMRDPRGIWVTQVYDSSGRVTTQTVDPASKDPGGLNRSTTYAYSTTGGGLSQVLITDPMGNQEQDTFAYGELVQKTLGYGTASAATWTYAYDRSSLGTVTTVDPDSHVSTASFDSYGNPLATVDAMGRVTTYAYGGNGGADAQFNQPTTITDGNGVTTTYTWDATYRILTQVSTPLVGASPPVNQVIQYQHTNGSHPTDVTGVVDGDGKTWSYAYDAYGDRTSTADPLGDTSASTYNADGWLLTAISPKGDPSVCSSPCSPAQYTTAYSYSDSSGVINFWGLATTVTDPLGHQTTSVYDADNNVIQTSDGDGNVVTYTFDNAGELTVTHEPDQTTRVTDYNADGTVADQKDGLGDTIQSYSYNSLAQAIAVTVDPGSSPHLNLTTQYGFDGLGNVLWKQDPGGSCVGPGPTGCTQYSYDADNEPSGITYSDGVTPNVSNIQYDPDGQRTSMTDGTGSWQWTYDSLQRLTSVTEGSNGTVSYQYNLRNLVTSIAYPGGVGSVSRGYDDAGRWTSVTDWNNQQTAFGYDPNSNLTSETMPTSGTAVVDSFSYNNADQMVGISDLQGSTSIFSATYSRDGNGQLASDSSATANQNSYAYTALNQLCYAGSTNTSACSTPPSGAQQFSYDAAGNLTTLGSSTQTFNSAGQLLGSGQSSYQYDNRGNRTSVTAGASTASYGYDQANRLCVAGGTATGCYTSVPAGDTGYCYNGDGLRMTKITAGSCAAPTTQETFGWDISGAVPLLLSDGGTSYVYGPGGLPLEQLSASGTLWYHHDQLGSTRAITNDNGTAEATYTFDPFGNLAASTGALNNQPFLFAGGYHDSESGFYYLRARFYDPTTAQFLSRDALTALSASPYAYVAGNPLNAIDPSGQLGEALALCLDPTPAEAASCTAGAGITAVQAIIAGLALFFGSQDSPSYVAPTPVAPPQPGFAAVPSAPSISITASPADTCIGGIAEHWLFAKQAPQLSDAEREAIANKDAGLPYDEAAYNSGMQKLRTGEKYSGQRRSAGSDTRRRNY